MTEATTHLVLGRRLGEQVVITVDPCDIATTITVAVIEERSGSNNYRLGFHAPRRVTIVRSDAKPRTRIDQQEND